MLAQYYLSLDLSAVLSELRRLMVIAGRLVTRRPPLSFNVTAVHAGVMWRILMLQHWASESICCWLLRISICLQLYTPKLLGTGMVKCLYTRSLHMLLCSQNVITNWIWWFNRYDMMNARAVRPIYNTGRRQPLVRHSFNSIPVGHSLIYWTRPRTSLYVVDWNQHISQTKPCNHVRICFCTELPQKSWAPCFGK